MPTMKTSGELIASISSDLADNNAGLISAFDVRHNMEDIAFSINRIVASGDTDEEFPFFNVLRVSKSDSAGDPDPIVASQTHGDLVVESGIFFPFADTVSLRTKRQTEPWLGAGSIDHGELEQSSLADDDHHQYLHRDGVSLVGRGNAMRGNFAMDQFWFNTSGIENVGLQFVQTSPDAIEQEINVSGQLNFLRDNSFIPNTAKGFAKAWINFDASGTFDGVENLPVVTMELVVFKGTAPENSQLHSYPKHLRIMNILLLELQMQEPTLMILPTLKSIPLVLLIELALTVATQELVL